MKKHILKRINEKLEASNMAWADNYIVMKVNSGSEDEEAMKQFNLATQNMKKIEATIDTLTQLLKTEEK